jgi:GTP-binding protein YchF
VVEFWDIAGLVKGAASGEGLGNKFLANIRNVSAIVHVVRAFSNDNIQHVEQRIDPAKDIDLIHTELILKDLDTLDAKVKSTQAVARGNPKVQPAVDMLIKLQQHLEDGKLASGFEFDRQDANQVEAFETSFLLTAKPMIFVVNSEESKITENIEKLRPFIPNYAEIIGMDIKLEAEISELDPAEQIEYLKELGLEEPALARLTREAYGVLGLISFFTAGEQEVRAWTITQGTKSPGAAGTIHTDFEKKFITSEVVRFEDFVAAGGWQGSKDTGKIKLGGRDYIVQDGDVMLFKHNA